MPRLPKARVALDHVVLEVQDPVRSAGFYGEVLGLRAVRLSQFRAGSAPFVSARVSAGTVLDFFPKRLWRTRTPRNPNHICFSLDRAGLRALEGRLRRKGIAITQRDPRNFGARGWGSSLYFQDPDGISLEARYYPAAE
jgi:catechol 2,3-dioxygenase-like lactoylglutathione lyase family enzyme